MALGVGTASKSMAKKRVIAPVTTLALYAVSWLTRLLIGKLLSGRTSASFDSFFVFLPGDRVFQR